MFDKIQSPKIINYILIFTLVTSSGIFSLEQLSFGAPSDVEVIIPPGTDKPGCEETQECYEPSQVTIHVGGSVTWINNDTTPHTVTSGLPIGLDYLFDSSLIIPGKTFSYSFFEMGEYDYLCIMHPWKQGIVVVIQALDESTGTNSTDRAGIVALELVSPLKQIQSGIEPTNVQCKSELVLVFKNSDKSPACVTQTTASKLVERGWAKLQ